MSTSPRVGADGSCFGISRPNPDNVFVQAERKFQEGQVAQAQGEQPPPEPSANVVDDFTERDPKLFGVRADKGGYTVDNKDQIFPELFAQIERELGLSVGALKACYLTTHGGTSFSHGVTGYREDRPDGTPELTVINIRGGKGQDIRLVNQMPLTEYIFGNERFKDGNPQRGAYNCDIDLVLLYGKDIDPAQMKAFAEDLDARSEAKEAKFTLLLPRVINVAREPLTWVRLVDEKERGNCARWSAEGLKAGNALEHNTIWPNRNTLRLIKKYGGEAVVIRIPRIEHATKTRRDTGANPEINPITTARHKLSLGLSRSRDERLYAPEKHLYAELIAEPGSYSVDIRRADGK